MKISSKGVIAAAPTTVTRKKRHCLRMNCHCRRRTLVRAGLKTGGAGVAGATPQRGADPPLGANARRGKPWRRARGPAYSTVDGCNRYAIRVRPVRMGPENG
jgi:hypothetical protein